MDGIELVVTSDFAGYKIGDVIKDQEKITEILAGPHEHNVVKRKAVSG